MVWCTGKTFWCNLLLMSSNHPEDKGSSFPETLLGNSVQIAQHHIPEELLLSAETACISRHSSVLINILTFSETATEEIIIEELRRLEVLCTPSGG